MVYSSLWETITELQSVTCHMKSQYYLPSSTVEHAPS